MEKAGYLHEFVLMEQVWLNELKLRLLALG